MAESQNGDGKSEEIFRAIDPVDLEPEDKIVIQDVAGDLEVRGTVLEKNSEWGRVSVKIREESGKQSIVSEETGRTFTLIERESEVCPVCWTETNDRGTLESGEKIYVHDGGRVCFGEETEGEI